MSVILGINAGHAGASAALIIDGKTVAAIAEERLNRVKYYAGFPKLAIRTCLEMAGLTYKDIDHVAIGRCSAANRLEKYKFALRNPSKLLNLAAMKFKRGSYRDLRQQIADECGAPLADLTFKQHNIEHHLAHTASAYFCSPWDHAAGFTLDGSGDFVTCMMSECQGDEITIKHRILVPESLGSVYTMIGEFIGYDRYGDEGKVMGLAPLGSDTYHDIFEEMLTLTPDGIELNPKFFLPFGANQRIEINDKGQMDVLRHHSDHMLDLFGKPRERGAAITQRDEDLAFGLQRLFEKGYMHLLNILHQLVPTDRVAMAGGCALNSVANGKLFDATPFQQTWIQPAAGDDGLALGAALYVSNSILKEGHRFEMTNAYLGPDYQPEQIRSELESSGVAFACLDRETLINETVDEITKGNVIGWFQGGMEWGPRALGNRSILAHPGLPGMKDTLNARIKHRESFRPFAPAVLEERQSEIFEGTHPSPYMLHVYKIQEAWRDRLCAVNHVDDTGRLQSVARHENPLYYDLIERFGEKTGIPVILNTSFNENEPIVCQPSEAIDCFRRTKMDMLVIGPYVCMKDTTVSHDRIAVSTTEKTHSRLSGSSPFVQTASSTPDANGRDVIDSSSNLSRCADATSLPCSTVDHLASEERHLRGYAVEWAEPNYFLVSRRNKLYESTTLTPPFSVIGEFPATAWKTMASRFRPIQRASRFMFYNTVRLPSGEVFATFGKSIGVFRDGQFHSLGGIARPFRVLRGACAIAPSGDVYFGEYFGNEERESVHIYRYRCGSDAAEIVYSFEPKEIRHVHGIYCDPYEESLWCLTGDLEHECKIMRTSDGFTTLTTVGQGDETWRAVSLQFRPDAVYYGMDAEFRTNHIIRLDRKTGQRTTLGQVDGPIYYSTAIGQQLYFGVTAELCPSQRGHHATLWRVGDDDQPAPVACHSKDLWFGRSCMPLNRLMRNLFMPGTLHFPAGPGLPDQVLCNAVGLTTADNRTFSVTTAQTTETSSPFLVPPRLPRSRQVDRHRNQSTSTVLD